MGTILNSVAIIVLAVAVVGLARFVRRTRPSETPLSTRYWLDAVYERNEDSSLRYGVAIGKGRTRSLGKPYLWKDAYEAELFKTRDLELHCSQLRDENSRLRQQVGRECQQTGPASACDTPSPSAPPGGCPK